MEDDLPWVTVFAKRRSQGIRIRIEKGLLGGASCWQAKLFFRVPRRCTLCSLCFLSIPASLAAYCISELVLYHIDIGLKVPTAHTHQVVQLGGRLPVVLDERRVDEGVDGRRRRWQQDGRSTRGRRVDDRLLNAAHDARGEPSERGEHEPAAREADGVGDGRKRGSGKCAATEGVPVRTSQRSRLPCPRRALHQHAERFERLWNGTRGRRGFARAAGRNGTERARFGRRARLTFSRFLAARPARMVATDDATWHTRIVWQCETTRTVVSRGAAAPRTPRYALRG